MYDLVITGATVVDPENNLNGRYDVGILDGKIAGIGEEIDPVKGRRRLKADGRVIVPGIIDMHVHVGFACQGRNAMPMMVKAGTVTALDCAGPLDVFLTHARHDGAGMNMLCLQMVRPGWNVSRTNPSREDLRSLVNKNMDEGALGLKLLGGHFPLTPDDTRRVIEVCNEERGYIANHVGTTVTGPANLNSFKEGVELSKNQSIQMVHVNGYCRGQVLDDPVEETLEVLSLLKANPNIISESYLSVFSCAPGKCMDGKIESLGAQNSLGMGGYPKDEKGLRQAILDRFASVVCELGDENIRLSGEEGLRYWESRNTDIGVTFPVTPASTRFLLATQKNRSGGFIVDALSTDGGGIPRNFIVEKGTALVRMDALSWEDFVVKTSLNPARILGLPCKGHLGTGADADITILEGTTGRVYCTINSGKIIMLDGVVLGSGTTVITTARGEKGLKEQGFEVRTLDLQQGWFYGGRPGRGGKSSEQ